MSPAPVSNDPGDDHDGDNVRPGDVPPGAGLMILADSSSDEEDDQNENMAAGIGYQLLTPGLEYQGPAGPDDSDDDDDDMDDGGAVGGSGNEGQLQENSEATHVSSSDEMNGSHPPNHHHHRRHPPHLQPPPLHENTELKELCELWKTPRLNSETAPMAQDQIDTIKSVMSGFSLPATNLPQWATMVPETEWKAQLLSRLDLGKPVPRTGESNFKHSTDDVKHDSLENV